MGPDSSPSTMCFQDLMSLCSDVFTCRASVVTPTSWSGHQHGNIHVHWTQNMCSQSVSQCKFPFFWHKRLLLLSLPPSSFLTHGETCPQLFPVVLVSARRIHGQHQPGPEQHCQILDSFCCHTGHMKGLWVVRGDAHYHWIWSQSCFLLFNNLCLLWERWARV